jgi:tRNA threonylcarbamoyladenosine biosynthesis protein TsaB
MIKEVLVKGGSSACQVDAWAVDIGPGSFTGTRIGVAAARTLALACGTRLVGIPSLDAIARNAREPSRFDYVCTILDAKRNNLYSALFKPLNGDLSRKGRYMLSKPEEILGKLKGKVLFLGDGIKLYRDKILADARFLSSFAPEQLWYPRASNIALMAGERLKKRKKGDSPYRLVPLYLYPKECTVRKSQV